MCGPPCIAPIMRPLLDVLFSLLVGTGAPLTLNATPGGPSSLPCMS